MNYNLLEEKWIPVLWKNGKTDRVGILEAFEEAGRIRQIAASNPMDRLAILRFLLALLYWCRGNPPDIKDANSGDSFPSDWFAKLDENRECFNLLGEGRRFYQDNSAKRNRPVTDLIQEIPTGNNFWHFRHSTDKKDGLCPSCCALGLLRLPLFSVSGLPDLLAGINGTPPIYIVPWGESLLETLNINFVKHQQLGDPAWVNPIIRPIPNESVPLLTGLTLLSRRVWLHEPFSPGICIGCGSKKQALIYKCEYQTSGKQENDLWDDPHVVYLDKTPRKAMKAADLTSAGKFRMDRPWPDMLARVVEKGKFKSSDKQTSLLVVSFATSKAKNIDVWERTIVMPSRLSIHDLSASFLQQWQKECNSLVRKLRPKNEKTSLKREHIEIPTAIAAIRPHVENKVSAKISELLTSADKEWIQAASEYRPMLSAVSKSISPGFTTQAILRRSEIAGALPNMRPKAGSEGKSGRKKGGET